MREAEAGGSQVRIEEQSDDRPHAPFSYAGRLMRFEQAA